MHKNPQNCPFYLPKGLDRGLLGAYYVDMSNAQMIKAATRVEVVVLGWDEVYYAKVTKSEALRILKSAGSDLIVRLRDGWAIIDRPVTGPPS